MSPASCDLFARSDVYSPLDEALPGPPPAPPASTGPSTPTSPPAATPPVPAPTSPKGPQSLPVRPQDACFFDVVVLVSDGIWHPPGAQGNAASWKPPTTAVARNNLVAALAKFLRGNPNAAFFFARGVALDDETPAAGPAASPSAKGAAATPATTNLWRICDDLPKDPSENLGARCTQTDLEDEWDKDPATRETKKAASAKKLHDDLLAFLGGLRCGAPFMDKYHPVKEYPRVTFEDAALLVGPRGPVCSGVLVAPDAVLTAKHCHPITEVRFGDGDGQPLATMAVGERADHPSRDVDASLLRLSRAVDLPVPLMRDDPKLAAPGTVVRYVGYGPASTDQAAPRWRKKILDLDAAGWGCDGERVSSTGCKPGWELVLPGGESRDTCNGDSGGPVYELWGNKAKCGHRLIAITSRRTADATIECGGGGIYTRVDALHPWMKQHIDRWAESRKDAK